SAACSRSQQCRSRSARTWELRRSLMDADAVEREVREDDGADQSSARNRSPRAGVARVRTVVAEEEVAAGRDDPAPALGVALGGRDVRLVEPRAVHEDRSVALDDAIPRQADQPLHERGAAVARAADGGGRRRLEDDDLAPPRRLEVVDDPRRDHAVVEGADTASLGFAQSSVGSIDDDGMRYGFAISASNTSTNTIAAAIDRIQSRAFRRVMRRRGTPGRPRRTRGSR